MFASFLNAILDCWGKQECGALFGLNKTSYSVWMSKRVSETELRDVFGRRLKEARKACRMTQEALAEAIAMSIDMVGRLERGTAQPSFETIARLCTALKVDAAFLFGGENSDQADTLNAQTRRLIDRVRLLRADDVGRVDKAIDLIVR